VYTAIFVGLFLAGWLLCAYIPWLIVSVRSKGEAGLKYLPLCLFAGVVGALAVPLLIDDGTTGLWLSFVVAAAVPAILLAIRHLTLPEPSADRRAPDGDSSIQNPQSKIQNR
jgi:hypothetical protein